MSGYAVIDTNVLISALLSDKEDAATFQGVKKIISSLSTIQSMSVGTGLVMSFHKLFIYNFRRLIILKKFSK